MLGVVLAALLLLVPGALMALAVAAMLRERQEPEAPAEPCDRREEPEGTTPPSQLDEAAQQRVPPAPVPPWPLA